MSIFCEILQATNRAYACLVYLQAEGWIEDKLKIAKEESFKNVRDIQDKMKSLKKHQAFEAEIMANADRIRAIKQVFTYTSISR